MARQASGAEVGSAVEAAAIAVRLAAVRERVAEAAAHARRSPTDVTVIAVSKTVPPQRVMAAIAGGASDLGENRVQEAEEKVPLLGDGVRWHLIGHLQRNKINKALALFQLIHSIDSLALAQAVGKHAQRQGDSAAVLLQVNLAGKETQYGFEAGELVSLTTELAGTPGLILDGLMCIAPEVPDPELARPYFHRLAQLHAELAPTMRQRGHPWRHLSMGMTNDFPVAVEEGATLVRVGRAIFGERPPATSAD